ncbi:hypothetical protein L484_008608 [Morus notabilis]|uniref:Uncharacterized protein n=1 Tax=Morus notabilis TaxID=981085 RepID=W9RU77_9ROSA|nr:hypothetical protein L484_008608 [Morus notabilis]
MCPTLHSPLIGQGPQNEVMEYRTIDIEEEDIGPVLKLDSMKNGELWNEMDILIFNTWLWWYRKGPKHGKEWNEPNVTNCRRETQPIKGSSYSIGLPQATYLVKAILSQIEKPVHLLDITTLHN